MIHRIQVKRHHLVAGLKISRSDFIGLPVKIFPEPLYPAAFIFQRADKVLLAVDLYHLFLHIAREMINFLLHILQGMFALLPGKIIDHLGGSLLKQKCLYQQRQQYTDNAAQQYAKTQFHILSGSFAIFSLSYHKKQAFLVGFFVK